MGVSQGPAMAESLDHRDDPNMERAPALAAVISGVALAVVPVVELVGTNRGDSDHADDGLRFLEESGYRFGLAGFVLVIAGLALVVAALGFAQGRQRRASLSLGTLTVTTLAVIGGTCYMLSGIIRHTSHGTIGYIAETDRAWAEAAYLGTHMIATQALLPMASHLLAAWLVGVAVVGYRSGVRRLAVVGVLPLLLLALFALDALVPGLDDSAASGVIWVGYILAMLIGLPASLVVLGLVAFAPSVRARLDAAQT